MICIALRFCKRLESVPMLHKRRTLCRGGWRWSLYGWRNSPQHGGSRRRRNICRFGRSNAQRISRADRKHHDAAAEKEGVEVQRMGHERRWLRVEHLRPQQERNFELNIVNFYYSSLSGMIAGAILSTITPFFRGKTVHYKCRNGFFWREHVYLVVY